MGTVAAGDRIHMEGHIETANKGATGGLTTYSMEKDSGTATITSSTGLVQIQDASVTDASSQESRALSGTFKVTGSGTLVMTFAGVSAGSDTTLAIGEGNAYVRFIRKS